VNPYAEAAESNVRALSASQRYAAALLLYNDDFHFKRKQSVVSENDEEDEEEEEEEEEAAPVEEVITESGSKSARQKALTGYSVEDIMNDRRQSAAARGLRATAEVPALYVIEGAYRILDEGISMFREGEVFSTYFEARKLEIQALKSPGSAEAPKVSPFRAGCITRQLRALEIYAMSPSSVSPPPAVKHILKRLNKALSPAGAKDVMKDMNYNPNASVAAAAVSAMRLKRGARFGVTEAEREADATQSSGSNSFYSSVTPWTEDVFDAAIALSEEVDRRRKENEALRTGPAGKKGPSGRMDYRSNSAEHPVMCVDGKKASFLDDAFSISPDTGEVLVHVVDVVGTLRRHELLQQTARDRISSTFLPSGPIHMLPPQALDSLKLSSSGPNEVITVALSVDSITGVVLGFRIFPSLIGPVFAIDVDTADEIIAGVGIKKGSTQGMEVSDRPGFPDAVVRDLLTVRRLMDKVVEKQPWVDVHFGAANPRQFKLNKKTDTYQQSLTEKTPANRMVNSLLTLYSNSSCLYCASKGVDAPVAWENRDRVDSAMVRRFGTQPLRNWLSQLQQKQLRAALKMELPLSRKECAMAVTHHNGKRKQTSGLVMQGRDFMAFESFETHCSNVFSSGETNLIFNAVGTGRGGIVRIKEFQVDGVVSVTVEKGERIRVRVKKIIPESKTVVLELISR
jgi:RNB domain